MKHLITCLALGIACAAGAQGTTIHEYPWNPDWNNDNYVGSSDLTGFLAAYGSEFGNPPEPCDYDGTPLEEFVISVLDGTIILDSIFVEYEIEDTGTYFLQGCPETVTDTIVYSGNSMLQPYSFGENVEVTLLSTNIYSNGNLELGLEFDASTGQYHWEFDFMWQCLRCSVFLILRLLGIFLSVLPDHILMLYLGPPCVCEPPSEGIYINGTPSGVTIATNPHGGIVRGAPVWSYPCVYMHF